MLLNTHKSKEKKNDSETLELKPPEQTESAYLQYRHLKIWKLILQESAYQNEHPNSSVVEEKVQSLRKSRNKERKKERKKPQQSKQFRKNIACQNDPQFTNRD